MAYLFPIGTVANATNLGTIEGISYSFFEPNREVSSKDMFNILVGQFEQQSVITRKKANPYINISYSYDGIFAREYNQIEHFITSIAQGGLTSFYVVDLSRGLTVSSVNVTGGGHWQPAIPSTRYFANTKIYAFINTPSDGFRLAPYTSKTVNASLTLNNTGDFGNLSSANAAAYGMIYPAYEAYCTADPLSDFKSVEYVPQNISVTADGGFTRTGSISFMSKYPST